MSFVIALGLAGLTFIIGFATGEICKVLREIRDELRELRKKSK